MKIKIDCFNCFFRQAVEITKLTGASQKIQRQIIDEIARQVPNIPDDVTPPEIARVIYRVIKDFTNVTDPLKKLKERSNRLALSVYPELKNLVKNSNDRLLTAAKIAIAGNVIDYGVNGSLNLEGEINKIFSENFSVPSKQDDNLFEYDRFKYDVNKARRILYISDNAGEVVFDRVLIEELKDRDIVYAVRGKPILNDALIEDAYMCGIDKVAKIISSGMDIPGTIISLASPEFLEALQGVDLIISKGQGNFETLSDEKLPIYFLFRVKCTVVAEYINCKIGSNILTQPTFKNKKD